MVKIYQRQGKYKYKKEYIMVKRTRSNFNWGLTLILFCLSLFWIFIIFVLCQFIIMKGHIDVYNANKNLEMVMEIKHYEYKIAMFREQRPQVLYDIIQCESGGNSFAKNPKSTALGIFQILDGTKALCERNLGVKIDRTNDNDSWDCALFLFERYGLQPWSECVEILGL